MYKTNDLLDLTKTRAGELLSACEYPWQALSAISDAILAIGKTLPEDEFDHPSEDIWIAKDAKVFPTAYIGALHHRSRHRGTPLRIHPRQCARRQKLRCRQLRGAQKRDTFR